jgi:hypothetical protein
MIFCLLHIWQYPYRIIEGENQLLVIIIKTMFDS